MASGLNARTQPEDAQDVEEADVHCGASSGHVLDGEVEHESTCGWRVRYYMRGIGKESGRT